MLSLNQLNSLRTLVTFVVLAASVSAQNAEPDQFANVANRVASALIKQDWNTFRSLAAPTFSIEEHWNAYDDFFVKQRGRQGALGWHAQKSIEYRTVITNTKNLPKNHLELFRRFGEQMRKAKERYPKDWLHISGRYERSPQDSFEMSGPNCSGKIASNLDIAVEFVRTDSGYRVSRLLLAGH